MDYFSLGIFIGSYIYYSLMQILTTQQATPRARCLLRDEALPVYYISLEQSANPSVHQFPCENNKELTKSVKEHGTVVNILVNFQKKNVNCCYHQGYSHNHYALGQEALSSILCEDALLFAELSPRGNKGYQQR